jgi:hypothetical protein
VLPSPNKEEITAADARLHKAVVGFSDDELGTSIFNINEYLGVDAADYATVQAQVGQKKNVGKATLTNSDVGSSVNIDTSITTW